MKKGFKLLTIMLLCIVPMWGKKKEKPAKQGIWLLQGTYDTHIDSDGNIVKGGKFTESFFDIVRITWEVERGGEACSILLERLDGTHLGCNVEEKAKLYGVYCVNFYGNSYLNRMAFVISESDAIKMPYTEFHKIGFGKAELKETEESSSSKKSPAEYANIYVMKGESVGLVKQVLAKNLFWELSQLPQGEYIVRHGEESFKIMVTPK